MKPDSDREMYCGEKANGHSPQRRPQIANRYCDVDPAEWRMGHSSQRRLTSCDLNPAGQRMLAMIGSIEKGLILWREAGWCAGEEHARPETMTRERRGRAKTREASEANPRRARFSTGATRRKQGKERGRPRASKGVAGDEALRRGLSMNGERATA